MHEGLALDVRDEESIQMIRNMSNSLTNDQISHLRSNLADNKGLNYDLQSRSLGADMYRSELAKFVGTSTGTGPEEIGHSISWDNISTRTPSINNTHSKEDIQQRNISVDSIEREGFMRTTFRRHDLSVVRDAADAVAGHTTDETTTPVFVGNTKLLRELTGNEVDDDHSTKTLAIDTGDRLSSSVEQEITFEFCSVEADMNYLLALSLNAALPNYHNPFLETTTTIDVNMNHNVGVLHSVSSSLHVDPVFFPSRLPSIVTSTYPEKTVSSIDSVNSFCFPDGVTSEV